MRLPCRSRISRRCASPPNRRSLLKHHRRVLLAEQLEQRRVLAGGLDFGDAPDTRVGSMTGDYATTLADDGARHEIVSGLYLGERVDADDGTLESSQAQLDDHSTILADLAQDYRAAVDPATLIAGEAITPKASGDGIWQYFTSETLDPRDPASNLRPMVWDTGMNALEDALAADHTNGSDGHYIGFSVGDELAMSPHRFGITRRPVARWTAGPNDAGVVEVEGRIYKASIAPSDGVRLLVYVDGVAILDQKIAGEDGRGVTFLLPGLTVKEGTQVDFVLDSNEGSDFDASRLRVTITAGDDEDGVVEQLGDLDILPHSAPTVTLIATNQTTSNAVIAGWIDYNADGVFDNASERAIATVPPGTTAGEVTLVFPEAPPDSVYTTYARFRLSADESFVTDPQPTGLVVGGEVEDYLVGRPTRVWDGEAGDNNLLNPINWSLRYADGVVTNLNSVPSSYDNVAIDSSFADQTLLLRTTGSERFRVRSIQSAAPIRIEEKGLLQINADSQIAALTLDGIRTDYGDSLASGSGFPTLYVDRDFVWNQAQINRLSIQVGGNLIIATDRPHELLASVLHVHGDKSIWSGGNVQSSGSSIYNHGTLTSTSNSDSLAPGPFSPNAVFVNATGATWIHDAPSDGSEVKDLFGQFYNDGTLEIRQGKLAFGDCCTVITHHGTVVLAENTELAIRGKVTFAPDSAFDTERGSKLLFDGSGARVEGGFDIGGTVEVASSTRFVAPVTVPKLIMSGNSIAIDQSLTVTDEFLFERGVLASGGQLISGGTTMLGATDTSPGVTLRGRWINQGTATWLGGNIGFGGGVIQNDGTFIDDSNAQMTVATFSSGTVENNATWIIRDTVGAMATAPRLASFSNQGLFDVGASNVSFSAFQQNDGTLQLDGGTIHLGSGSLTINAGVLSGVGQVNANVTQSGGVISPGTSPGILNIQGNLVASGGELLIEIAGPPVDPNEEDAAGLHYDRLNVSGDASIANLNVELLENFQPTLGSRYTVVVAGGLSGPANDDAASLGMTIPGSDAVIELVVTNELNTPPIADAGGPYVGVEGSSIQLDGSASVDAEQSASSLTYEWDLNYDGTTFDVDVSGQQVDQLFVNQVTSRTIALRVQDASGLSDLSTTTLRIDNVAPQPVRDGDGAVSISSDEDGLATLIGDFTDPGIEDVHSVEVQWGDGTAVQRVDLTPGQRSFSISHDYGRNSTGASREFAVIVHVYDETESNDSQSLTLVQPFINQPPTARTGGPYVVDEGQTFVLDATTSTDPDQATDSLSFEWDFGYDGITFAPDANGSQVMHSRDNNRDAPFTYAVRVTDAQGLSDIAATSVTVRNVAPRLVSSNPGDPPLVVDVDASFVATVAGVFEDPGSDTHTVTIDWGDGTPLTEVAVPLGVRQFTATHNYPPPVQQSGTASAAVTYEIAVTLTDQDGGVATASRELTIDEPASVLRGVKYDDRDGDGIRDDDEPGLAGWVVELVEASNGDVVSTAVTDSTGAYEFAGVSEGDYLLREVQQWGWRQTSPLGEIERISLDLNGNEADGQNDAPSIAASGRFVAFSSLASNLVAGDDNGWRDIFVKDTVSGEVRRVSLPIDGGEANGPSYEPSISADGTAVVFRSLASNLVQDDRNDASDIFLYDLRTGATRRVSVNLDRGEANGESLAPVISGDGQFVAFTSTASNLVPGDTNAVADVFVADLYTGLIQRVSVAGSGTQSDRDSYQPSISHDGRYVAFTSGSRTFDSRDRDEDLDVYLYDRARDSLTWISRNFSGEGGNGDSHSPALSAEGGTVAFVSSASNLFPDDFNGFNDVFVWDAAQGQVRPITRGNGPSAQPSLTHDGSQVWFSSQASDLVANDTNYGIDLFVFDRQLEYTQLVGQAPGDLRSHFVVDPQISADGGTLVFASYATDLVPDDANTTSDIFIQSTQGVHRVQLTEVTEITGLDFGNEFRLSTIRGQKFADVNGNGQRDVDSETGGFVEPGLDGWTIRLVDARTGQTWETTTESIDLNADGVIDPIVEQGIYEFGPLEPGDYEVYELAQDGWFPSFPRVVLPPPPNYQSPPRPTDGPTIPSSSDPRLAGNVEMRERSTGPSLPVFSIPAVAEGVPEQLPILYVKGFNDDGASWGQSGRYFETLADVTGGRQYQEGSANVTTFGVQFWNEAGGDPNVGSSAGVANDRAFAVLKTTEELSDPATHYAKPGAQDFAGQATQTILSNLADPTQWIPVCENFPDLSSCTIPALEFDFQAARSDYNQNGLAKYHADDLFDLLAEQLGQPGLLESFSQVNFVTHSAGGLDTRALMSLLQESNDDVIQQSVANVIYTAPPFGGSTLAELAIPFFENDSILTTLSEPWTTEVLLDAALGPFETLLRALVADPIVNSVYQASDYLTGQFDSVDQRLAVVPDREDVFAAIDTTMDDLDNLIKTISGSFGASFGIRDIDNFILQALNTFSEPIALSIIDDVIVPTIKQVLTFKIGLPGLPKIRDDLRPYEAVHENVEKFAPNLDIPQFVVWGEGGFLNYVAQMAGVDTPLATPVNLGPPLDEAAADPNSLHAYGDANRNGLDFSTLDLQPGDGNLSRTSALFMTDLAGGYMTALAGFARHTHGSITLDLAGLENNIQGSFLSNDDDNSASVGEVLIETFLTPVTSLQIFEPTTVVDSEARLYAIAPEAEIAFEPAEREFEDMFGRQFRVTANEVEYRISMVGSEPTPWRSVNPNTFRRSIADITDQLGFGGEGRFTLQWRSINQQGGREAIRSAEFVIDGLAPSLRSVSVIDAELPNDNSQISRPGALSPILLLNSDRVRDRFDGAVVSQLPNRSGIDWVVSLDRDKQIELKFDSPTTFEYAWNEPSLTNLAGSFTTNSADEPVTLLLKQKVPFEIPSLGSGVISLNPGTHTLYYRLRDTAGNESPIESLTVLVDDQSPDIRLSAESDQIVGRETPLTYFATDVGAGIGEAWIDVPGIGKIRPNTRFSLGESNLADQIQSGDTVTLPALAADRVANVSTADFPLVYDFLPPEITVESIDNAVTFADGRVITTLPTLEIVISALDETSGVDDDSLGWSLGEFDSGYFTGGTFQVNELGQYVTQVPLAEGLNSFLIQVSDLVGNKANRLLTLLRAPGHRVTTDRGDRVDRVDFGNTSFGSIHGVAYDDVNENGERDRDEQGVSGFTLYLDRNENGRFDSSEPTAVTGDRGDYQFDNVLPRSYVVRAVTPLGWQGTRPGSDGYDVTLEFGQSVKGLDFGFAFLGSTIGGVVFDDVNGNGRRDAAETGLADFAVSLDINADGDKDLFGVTDEEGRFAFPGLESGQHEVLIAGRAGWTVTTDEAVLRKIEGVQIIEDVEFGVFAEAGISGVVFADANGNQNRDPGESNLPGWLVLLDLHSDGTVDSEMTTSSTGFDFADVPAGTHRLRVVDQPGWTRTTPGGIGSYEIVIQSGSLAVNVLFGVNDRRGSITGTKFYDRNADGIRQASEVGLAGWTIFADLDDDEVLDADEPRAVTDASGYYDLRVVAGEYVIREVAQEGWVQTFPRSFQTEAVTNTDRVKSAPRIAGDYILWGEFESSGLAVKRFDGTQISTVFTESDQSVIEYDLDAQGRIVWIADPDSTDDDDRELYLYDGNAVRRQTRNGVDDDAPVLVDGKIAWKSGSSVLLRDGQQTYLLTQGGGNPTFDGESVVFLGFNTENNRLQVMLYDGASTRVISDPNRSIIAVPTVAGDYVVWVEVNGGEVSVQLYDGQTRRELAPPGEGGAADVDEQGRVVWLKPTADRTGSDVMYFDGANTIALTDDGKERDHLAIDDGIVAWTTQEPGSSARVSIFDGRQLLQPEGFLATTLPAIDDGRVAFLGFKDSLGDSEIYVADARTYHRVSIGPNGTVESIDFGNQTEETILSGTVFDDVNANGSFDSGESPLNRAMVEVRLLPSRELIATVETDSSGFYELVVEPFEQYRISVAAESDELVTVPIREAYTITANPGSRTDALNFGISTEILISGRVFHDLDGDGSQDGEEPGLNNENIDILDAQTGNRVLRTKSNSMDVNGDGSIQPFTETGFFELSIPRGDYIVRVVPQTDWYPTRASEYAVGATQTSATGLRFGLENLPSQDSDGIPDVVENEAPNGGDGNRDGVPDSEQRNVASLPNLVDGTYLTLVAPAEFDLVAVASIANPAPDNSPSGLDFPVGFLSFEIHGVPDGGTVNVELILHNSVELTGYYKYGPTPDNSEPHFYAFNRTKDYGVQKIKPGMVQLRYTDGMTGDDDLESNGIIVDPGVPAIVTDGPAQNPVEPTDVNNDDQTTALDALLVINALGLARGAGEALAEASPQFRFLDVNGDRNVSSVDALQVVNAMARFRVPAESELVTVMRVAEQVEREPKHLMSVDRSRSMPALPTSSVVKGAAGWKHSQNRLAPSASYDLLHVDRHSDNDFRVAADEFFTTLGENADDRLLR